MGMQFPAEFEWISPSGRGLLTAYMPNHYWAGWRMDSAATLEEAEQAAYELFLGLKPVAATRNVLLPVGADYTPPTGSPRSTGTGTSGTSGRGSSPGCRATSSPRSAPNSPSAAPAAARRPGT